MGDHRVVYHAARRTAVVRATIAVDEVPGVAERALRRVLSAMEAQGVLPAGEPFVLYRGAPGPVVELECGFPTFGAFLPTPDVVVSELPSTRAMVGVHNGSFESVPVTYAAMRAWACSRGLTPLGCAWLVHLTDPERETDASSWQSELWLPVE